MEDVNFHQGLSVSVNCDQGISAYERWDWLKAHCAPHPQPRLE